MMQEVYVLGVGMHRFNNDYLDIEMMADVAASAALVDASASFGEIGILYNGYVGGRLGIGVDVAKELGMTGIPVIHVENASATGATAFGEAVQIGRGSCRER